MNTSSAILILWWPWVFLVILLLVLELLITGTRRLGIEFLVFIITGSAYYYCLNKSRRALSMLVKMLDSKDWRVRREAIDFLGSRASKDAAAFNAINRALDDENETVRTAAADVLFKLRRNTIPYFIELLDDEKEQERFEACRKLQMAGFDAAPALPKLKEIAATDPDAKVRDAAKNAIIMIQPLPFKDLVRLLNNPNNIERRYAATALGYVGPEAIEALPMLGETAKTDRSRSVRKAAQKTITRIEKHM